MLPFEYSRIVENKQKYKYKINIVQNMVEFY